MRWKKPKKNSTMWVLVIGAFAIFAWFEGSLFGNFDKFNNKTEISSSISDVNIGGVFNLIDHTGKRVTEASFPGRYKLVFFGYTWCPDICPTELLVISQVLERLGDKSKNIAALFITIDPARDTQEKLAAYLSNFHPELIGLTGTDEEIATAAKSYRVYYNRADQNDHLKDEVSKNDYIMDHSVYIYLVSPDDKYIQHFVQGDEPDEIAREVMKNL